MTMVVGIYLFAGVEVLDFAGPFEVFTTASRVAGRRRMISEAPFEVVTIAAEARIVSARAGLLVQPHYDFANHPALDILIVPGGDVTAPLASPTAIAWVKAASPPLIASVCSGALILGKAGRLDGLTATTHWADLDELREMLPQTRVVGDRRWVDEGRIATSAGISAGIDLSLHLVERFCSGELARATARQMEYDWREPGGRPAELS
jgi:transcriptional regulator GlxA family with amidase domain